MSVLKRKEYLPWQVGMEMSKGKNTKKQSSCCDTCSNYVYDEEYEYYTCEMNLDEDEMGKFMTDSFYNCPYYQLDDEYAIVRKQN